MTQLQDDLRQLGEELWPDAAPLHPDRQGAAGASFRWRYGIRATLAGFAAAALFVGAIAAGTIVLVARQHASGPAGSAVVPWLDAPTGDSAKPFTIPAVGACRAGDLSVSISVPDPSYIGHGPINTSFWSVSVRDVSSKPCYVTGTFEATFQTESGTLNALRRTLSAPDLIYLYPATQSPPAGFVSLATGELGSSGTCSLPPVAAILWSPGPGLGAVRVSPGPAGGSGTPCSGRTFSYYAELYPAAGGVANAALVQATLAAPSTASAGEHLQYTVTIVNTPVARSCVPGGCPTAVPSLSLQPCPTYHEELEGVDGSLRSYVLNCADAKPLAAGAKETFDMFIDVPRDAAPGPVVLLWAVDGNPGVFQAARTYVNVVVPSATASPHASGSPSDLHVLPQSLTWDGVASGSLLSAEASCDAPGGDGSLVDLNDTSNGVDISFPAKASGVFAQQLPSRTVYMHLESGIGPERYTGFDAVSGSVSYTDGGGSGTIDTWLAPDTSPIDQSARAIHLTGSWRCR